MKLMEIMEIMELTNVEKFTGLFGRLFTLSWLEIYFFLLRGKLFEFSLQGYYRGIVHDFPLVHWIFFEEEKTFMHIIDINTHQGEKCSSGAQIAYGVMPGFMLPNENMSLSRVRIPIRTPNPSWSPPLPSSSVTFFTSYCTVLYCTVLYCTVLYCTVLYCTVLYCTVLSSPLLSSPLLFILQKLTCFESHGPSETASPTRSLVFFAALATP